MTTATDPLAIGFDVPFKEAIQAAVTRGVVLPNIYYGELQGIARQLAFSIAGIAAYDQLTAVRDSLASSMASGQSFKDWKKSAVAQNLGLPDYRLENIWRTNTGGCYERGRWEQIMQTRELLPYLMYDAINDSRTRENHLALDGVIRRWDDPEMRGKWPKNGHNCRCTVQRMTEAKALRLSKSGANGLPRGVNKPATGTPDPGWDYHPYEDRWRPIQQALANRAKAPNASPVIGEALAGLVEGSLMQLYAQWVADHGEDEAKAMWERYFKGQALPQ